ncbi:hypothetical protein Aph01nite_66790 [Acrocarpospora phusangensis]|uniref:N-acetyltransferase domain-containing protein n=1 Tax=Acrocarpospora phusangensis TaxID=1070424 RepID=A0A919UNY8_9ACTN|nr:GNAT family N-acetyltransferase [Acrocarpospora phusangensis]GIH28369.1 hypothetical protein Aph01nite_66790 [Acrocarpospora phusangensis]
MENLHVRPCRIEDAAAVADLINVVLEAGGAHGGHVAAEVEDALNNEVKDLVADTRVVIDAEGRLVAVALVPHPPEGGDRIELIGGVHPDRRGSGIGRELLTWQFDRAAAHHAKVAPDMEWSAQVAVGADDTSAIRLFDRFGLTVGRYFLQMTAPTASPQVVTPADGVRIAPYHHDQEREVHAVHMAAFRELWGHQERGFEPWAALTVRSEAFLPELSRLAFSDNTIIGYVLTYASLPGKLYIGQVGTSGSWRRRGIASALLSDILSAAHQAGYTHATLDTDADNPTGASGIYTKVGFATNQRVVIYHKSI